MTPTRDTWVRDLELSALIGRGAQFCLVIGWWWHEADCDDMVKCTPGMWSETEGTLDSDWDIPPLIWLKYWTLIGEITSILACDWVMPLRYHDLYHHWTASCHNMSQYRSYLPLLAFICTKLFDLNGMSVVIMYGIPPSHSSLASDIICMWGSECLVSAPARGGVAWLHPNVVML